MITALVIFLFRMIPSPGEGINWWQMDVRHFDQRFQSILTLVANISSIVAVSAYLCFWPISSVLAFSAIVGAIGSLLSIPYIAMFGGYTTGQPRLPEVGLTPRR